MKSFVAGIVVAVTLATGAVPVLAQDAFSEVKLAAFIEAAVAVNRLREHWSQQINGAQNETEANALIEQANAQMRQAVERTDGISMEEYIAIVESAEKDPALSARLGEMFQQKVGN